MTIQTAHFHHTNRFRINIYTEIRPLQLPAWTVSTNSHTLSYALAYLIRRSSDTDLLGATDLSYLFRKFKQKYLISTYTDTIKSNIFTTVSIMFTPNADAGMLVPRTGSGLRLTEERPFPDASSQISNILATGRNKFRMRTGVGRGQAIRRIHRYEVFRKKHLRQLDGFS